MVEVSAANGSVSLPVLIEPGVADGVLGLTLGHGRKAGGEIAQTAEGTNVAPLLGVENTDSFGVIFSAKVRRAEGTRSLVRTQKAFSMEGRPIVLDGTLAEYRQAPDFVKRKRHLPEKADLYPPWDYSEGHKWGMAIDLNACVGCGACIAACQAENNIAIVGREQCGLGREMHWLRLDHYRGGDPENPTSYFQPMLCQHCDNAPCESVCPVNATSHSPEGLNEMTYNRCVGTRYCSNNCPYKVRRFNFSRFHDAQMRDPVQELAFNPQVTVRGVGVMEKCTFCVQRINEAKYKALNADEPLPDGAVRTACQQACPANAIVFGDLNVAEARIVNARRSGRAYRVLEELNVEPNVTYLARIRNPHPDLADAEAKEDHHA
jgi:Fe-S-cluster-containing dehydrogenase component